VLDIDDHRPDSLIQRMGDPGGYWQNKSRIFLSEDREMYRCNIISNGTRLKKRTPNDLGYLYSGRLRFG